MSELYELPEGWEWKKLKDKEVCTLVMGQSPKSDTYNTDGNGMAFFQGKTEFGEMYPTVVKYCTAPKKIAEVGDILLSVRAPVGPTNIANIQCAIGRGLGAIRPNTNNTLTNYLLYFFRNFEIEISQKGKGSTFSAITKTELENTDIPLPPLQEQKRIVAKLDNLFEKIDKSIALHQKNMDEADVFMGSVLNEVFGELEKKYEKVKLSTIVKIIGGGTPSKKEKSYWNNGTIKWATVGDMNVETINDTELSITDNGLKNSSSNIIPQEAIIIATRVGLGKVCYLNDDTAINQDLKGLLPLTDELNSRFLFNYFKNIKKFIISHGTGATVKGVKLNFIKELLIPLPPLNIQQKNIAYLDNISKKIEKIKSVQKDKMQSLVALKASILDQAFRGEL